MSTWKRARLNGTNVLGATLGNERLIVDTNCVGLSALRDDEASITRRFWDGVERGGLPEVGSKNSEAVTRDEHVV